MAQEVVANYMDHFYMKSRTDRILTVMDWIRYTARGNGIKPMYYLPFSNDDSSEYVDDDERKELMKILSVHKVCRSAQNIIIDFGCIQWVNAEDLVDTCSSPSHGLQNRRANSGKYFDKHIKADIYQYFTDLEMLATPQATRVVCDIAGTCLRDG
jgi:hypothetical protein